MVAKEVMPQWGIVNDSFADKLYGNRHCTSTLQAENLSRLNVQLTDSTCYSFPSDIASGNSQ
ncbi:MAG: hypothetical protein GXO58_10710 [Thermodesulfobacteria bacterium]|nr:hypothetical protein [Thermodesulfobacteriota bacterium]